MEKKLYRIVASCDAYNARSAYRGQEVLKTDAFVPVKWIEDDNLGGGYATEDEAKEALFKLALKICYDGRHDSWDRWDDDGIAALQEELRSQGESDVNIPWYHGEGVYSACQENMEILLEGEGSFRDDIVFYEVEEYESVRKEFHFSRTDAREAAEKYMSRRGVRMDEEGCAGVATKYDYKDFGASALEWGGTECAFRVFDAKGELVGLFAYHEYSE